MMTQNEIEVFTQNAVLNHIAEVVAADESNGRAVESLNKVARGMNPLDAINFVSILKTKYKVVCSI